MYIYTIYVSSFGGSTCAIHGHNVVLYCLGNLLVLCNTVAASAHDQLQLHPTLEIHVHSTLAIRSMRERPRQTRHTCIQEMIHNVQGK